MNLSKLKAYMVQQNKTASDVAAACGMSPSSWFNKTQGRSDFTVREVVRLKEFLRLTNAQISEIFFAK